MNKTMRIAIPVTAGIVAIGTGIGLAAAKAGGQNAAPAPATQYDATTTTPAPTDGTLSQYCGAAAGAGMMGQMLQVTTERVATLLGTDATNLKAQLQAGKTLADLAKEKGVGQDVLVQTILGPMTDQMNLMVKYGYLTQDQAKAMLQRAQTEIQTVMTSELTDLNGFGFMGGMMGGGTGGMMGGSGGGMMGGGTGSMMGGSGGGMMGGGTGSMMGGSGGGMMGSW